MNNEKSEPGACGCGNSDACPHRQAPRGKLVCHNWLSDLPAEPETYDMVEVMFKNTRKGFFKNSTHLPLEIGDWVAVEASPGHDIGQITMIGPLVELQMRKAKIKPNTPVKRVFRKAKPSDLEKFEEAKAKENDTMIRARQIAEDLKLNMKIGDVEYQGDGNKAIFYYIADDRVDFRQLIKVLAEAFKVRIEMKQIGARQEAGRIGGIGPCGRALCCASWLTNFQSVGTAAARFQDISLNPQKLAGQCAKLKCCLNYEVDSYVEAVKRLPAKEIRLETADATYFHFKHDVFKGLITYSTDKAIPANLVTITAERAFDIIAMNRNGEKPLSLLADGNEKDEPRKHYSDILGQDSINRFDKEKKKKKKRNKSRQQQQRPDVENTGAETNQPRGNEEQPAQGQNRPQNQRNDRRNRNRDRRNRNEQNNQQQKSPQQGKGDE